MFNNKKYEVVFVSIVSFVFISCGQFFFPYLEIKNVNIEDKVCISFSSIPNEITLKDAFTLRENGVLMDGYFVFEGINVCYYPRLGIKSNCDYELKITTDVEDMRGCSLQKEYSLKHSTKEETVPPQVESITPLNDALITDASQEIKIVFSEAVNEISFLDAFNIEPEYTYYRIWNEDFTSIAIRPEHPIEKGKRFIITISTKLKDLSNNYMQNDFKSSFQYESDVESPTYTLEWKNNQLKSGAVLNEYINNSNIPFDSNIILTFSEQIPLMTVPGFFSMKPPLPYVIEYDSEDGIDDLLQIVFTATPEFNKVYNFTINKGISDESGNAITETRNYKLEFNHPRNKPVEFLKGYLENGVDSLTAEPIYQELSSSTNYSSVLLSALDFPENTPVETRLFLVFQISSYAENLDIFSAMKSIGLSATNSCSDFSIYSIGQFVNDEIETLDISSLINYDTSNSEVNYCVILLNIELTNSINTGIIKLTINKDLCDVIKNTMQSDIILMYNKD